MEVVARILKSTFAGVALGAVLTTVVFAASVLVDGGRVGVPAGRGRGVSRASQRGGAAVAFSFAVTGSTGNAPVTRTASRPRTAPSPPRATRPSR